ncbi:MAG: ACT domain-containing protein, partial [Culicoidibacterales bacterium]
IVGIGNKTISATTIVNRLLMEKEHIDLDDIIQQAKANDLRKKSAQSIVSLGDIGNVSHQFAKCCKPIFGDDIIGYVSQSKGLVVHRRDCRTLQELDHKRFADVTWSVNENSNVSFDVNLQVQSFDRNNLLNDLVQTLYKVNTNIKMLNSIVSEDQAAEMQVTLTAQSVEQLKDIIKHIERIPGVFKVLRVDSFE